MKTIQITGKRMDLAEIANLAIQFDHETDTVKFVLPGTYDGKSLPTSGWGVRYQLSNTLGDLDLVDATLVEGNLEILYPFQGGVVSRPGLVSLSLQCIQDGKIVYQTLPGVIKVVRQIDPSNLPRDEDILSRYLSDFEALLEQTSGEKTLAQQAAGAAAQSASDAEGFKTQAAGSATNAHNSELAAKGYEEGAGLIKNAIDGLVASAPFQAVVGVADDIPTVADVAEDIPAVAGAALSIPVVAGVADEVSEVAAIKEAIVAVDGNRANITAVAAKLTDITTVAAKGADITTLAGIQTAISALALITADITGVSGVKADVSAVALKLTEIQGVYAQLAAIEGLYGKSDEIDALYAQLDTIAAKANQSDMEAVEDALATLNADADTEGSVAKAVKDAVDPVSTELSTVKVKTTENDLAIQAIQRDQTLANQSEAKITTSDYGIVALPKNATGNLKMKREGLTARNIVDGASVAIGGTVTFASVLNSIYYDTLHKVQITGTGSDIVVTNDSGAIANMSIINLTQTFASIPTLAQCKNIFPSYFADTKNVPMTGRYRGRGKNLFDKSNVSILAGETDYLTGNLVSLAYLRSIDYVKILGGTIYTLSGTNLNRKKVSWYDKDKVFISGQALTDGTYTSVTLNASPANAVYMRVYIQNDSGGTLDEPANIQIELGSTATTYAPYEAHDQYFTAPEGRSVPSAKDSVEVQDGRLVHVKRVRSINLSSTTQNWLFETILESNTTAAFYFSNNGVNDWIKSNAEAVYINKFAFVKDSGALVGEDRAFISSSNNLNMRLTFSRLGTTYEIFNGLSASAKLQLFKDWLDAENLVLFYQLATPITTPIDSDGIIPAGASVYWEPAIPDVGIYTTKFDILDTDHPIASIDKLYKVDFATGVQTLLTDVVVAGDGPSFTSASLADGDLVNVIYFYSVANPEGLTTAEYLNSNVVVADSANGKYYKYKPVITNGAIASWTLTEVV